MLGYIVFLMGGMQSTLLKEGIYISIVYLFWLSIMFSWPLSRQLNTEVDINRANRYCLLYASATGKIRTKKKK